MTEYEFEINGSPYKVKIKESLGDHAIVEVNGTKYRVDIKTPFPVSAPAAPAASPVAAAPKAASAAREVTAEDGLVRAPLPGVIRKLMHSPGDAVEAGEPILVLEAMKMENEIKAPVAGTIAEFFIVQGDSVNTGDSLFRIQH
jgi:glutaconyl-CoA decarboxylase